MTESSPPASNRGFGIDVGGSGVKGGIVDLDTGQLIGDRYKLLTPQPSTPDAVAATIAEVVRHFDWTGPLGVTYPGVITHGLVRTAANVDKTWIGTRVDEVYSRALDGQPVTVLNDADAASVAEQRDATGKPGVVVGFAAETENLVQYAQEKLIRKKLDLIVANDVSAPDSGFAVSTNRVVLVSQGREVERLPLLDKGEVAERILDRVVKMWEEKHAR